MTIRNKLLFVTLLPIVLALAIGTVLFLSFRQLKAVRDRSEVADEIVADLFDLSTLTYEYLRYHGQRAMEQRNEKQASLSESLRRLEFSDPEDRENLARMRENNEKLASLFFELSSQRGRHPSDKDPVARELERRLTGQLLLRSQALVEHASSLAHSSREEATAIGRRTNLIVIVFVAAAAALLAGVSFLVRRSVVKPIARLHEGTVIIGAGDLDHRIGHRADDELGELSTAFDGMTQRLRKTTVSRDALAKEMRVRKWAEAELKQTAAALERSNQELEQFAYVASHDLQEPLRMIASYLQLLERRYKGKLDEAADEFIEFAVDGAKRMQILIKDLLAYSRVGTRGEPFEPLDVDEVVTEAITDLHAAIEGSSADVTRDVLPKITGDRIQLMRLFENLISNALKFHGNDSPRVHVSADRTDDEWVFSVRDNGIGIDKEHADRVFVIFQRLHGRTEYEGSGMGLAICKRIVERHGGRIWVESEPGQGTTFFFTIPCQQAADVQVAAT